MNAPTTLPGGGGRAATAIGSQRDPNHLALLPTRGTPRNYRRWPVTGLPRGVRERIERRDRILAGFTARGGARRPRLAGALNGLAGRARRNAWLALHRQANYAMGLTARGTPRKMFTKPFTT